MQDSGTNMTWLIDDEFCFFCCVWTRQDLSRKWRESTCIWAVYLEILEISPFPYKSHFHQNLFFVCPVAFPSKDSHQEFPVCWRQLLDRKHWGYKNGKREREFGACQSSRVVRCSFGCRFSDWFLKSTTHGGNESKICHQGLLAKNI